MKTNAQRAKEFRERKKEQNIRRTEVYLSPENHEKLIKACKWEGKSISEMLNLLIASKLQAKNWNYRNGKKIVKKR